MDIGLQLPPELQEATKTMIGEALNEAIKNVQTKNSFPPYMTKQEASKYLHVSPVTFNKWQQAYNIPVVQIENVKRYKKTSLDKFMQSLERKK